MTALTKIRQVKVRSYDELNDILIDIQIDEDSNIIGPIPNPIETIDGFIFTVTYHIKNMERELEKNEITSVE